MFILQRVLEFRFFCQLKGFLIEAKRRRCQRPSGWPPGPLTRLPRKPPGTPPQLRPGTSNTRARYVMCRRAATPESVAQAGRPKRWLCSSGVGGVFLDAAQRTTQKKWLLSTSWLTIKRNVLYFPYGSIKTRAGSAIKVGAERQLAGNK